jgi:c-di-GMP-binding flagellar brake protein YcgR
MEPEILRSKEITDVLDRAVAEKNTGVMSYLAGGKWHIANVSILDKQTNSLSVELQSEQDKQKLNIREDQPVGITIQQDFNKFIFETSVTGFGPDNDKNNYHSIKIRLPEVLERMQRRAYLRVLAPKNMKVNTLFWHRGYIDEIDQKPTEDYWQGTLIDLSAGGLQIGIDKDKGHDFKDGQLIGIKFTPMSYQKPIVVEAQIKHIADTADAQKICIGVEFLGLGASAEGREKLRRIVGAVSVYQMKNQGTKEQSDEALVATEAREAAEPMQSQPEDESIHQH